MPLFPEARNVDELRQAAAEGHDPNQPNPYSPFQLETAMIIAVIRDDLDSLRFLLSLPDIDVNAGRSEGSRQNALQLVLHSNHASDEILDMMLHDPRFDLTCIDWLPYLSNLQQHSDKSRLWICLAAAGERIHDIIFKQQSAVLQFLDNPVGLQTKARIILGDPIVISADFFASMVALTDGYLRLRETAATTSPKTTRFLRIGAALPIELQMILACRAVGSAKQVIRASDTELVLMSLLFA
jgi:hypothetical protein